MNRREAIALAQKIRDIREHKFRNQKISFQTLLRLSEMDAFKRQCVMERLVEEGYARSVSDIERMLRSRDVCRFVTPSYTPTESVGMSDDRLDAGIQNVSINRLLCDF